MKKPVFITTVIAACAVTTALAQHAPGEDPIVLNRQVSTQMLPSAASRPSLPLDAQNTMPAWLKAKVVRYEAKASSAQNEGILSDADVARSASSDGFKKTCVQEVGSNSIASGAASGTKNGVGNNQQIVVLKGDLVNICR